MPFRRPRRKWLMVAVLPPLLLVGAAFMALAGGSGRAAALAVGGLDRTVGEIPAARRFAADSLVYDRNLQLIADLHPAGETRWPVSLDRIAPVLQQATVDVEDRNFWHEGALDPGRVLAVAWYDLTHDGALQGASTITQQLAKVEYLDSSATLSRKMRELFVAHHLESTLTKHQILEEYLNDIPYGHGATGIEAAAHVFFNTSAAKLDLAQAALLAGLPDAPTNLDPLTHLAAAKQRQRVVLEAMVRAGDITLDQAALAYTEDLKLADGNADNVNLHPAFVARVSQAIGSELKIDPARAGLSVVTTLDSNLQRLAQQLVAQQVQALHGNDVSNGALVSLNSANGEVLAYVGSAGPNVPGGQIDMASAPRQPGSTFKLFTYATAIDSRKLTMLSPVLDAPFSLPTGGGAGGMQPWVVQNYDMRYHGLLPVAMALGNSLNVPAVKVELQTGIPDIVNKARAMGVTTLDQPPRSYTPSLTLGGYVVPLWEMAQAATVFADQGKLHPARFALSVKDGGGKELLPAPSAPKQALDPGTAFIMNNILGDDGNRLIGFGPGSALTLPGHIVSAKTGTTTDFKDNLTIGWTPALITATWVGNADNHPMKGTTGVTGAAPIWHAFMDQALKGKPDNWPGPPPNVQAADYQGHHGFILQGTSVSGLPGSGVASPGGMKRADDGVCQPWTQIEQALRAAGYRGPYDHGPAMKAAYERASHTTLTAC